MRRKERFSHNEIFHVFNKSISNYGIFKDLGMGQRFLSTFEYYNNFSSTVSFSFFDKRKKFKYKDLIYPKDNTFCKVLSYCIMPDHYHFLVKILKDNLFSKLMNNVENSYSRYFNIRFNRKGPLWQSPFKCVKVRFDEQLLHVSRYIHLNPTTKGLVEKPEDWLFSSYRNFIEDRELLKTKLNEFSIHNNTEYKSFTEKQIEYLQKLKNIKKLFLE